MSHNHHSGGDSRKGNNTDDCHHGEGCCEDQAEQQHFREVVASFESYAVEALEEVHEFAASVLSHMSIEERQLLELPTNLVDETAAAIKLNQEICDMIVMAYGSRASVQGAGVAVTRRNVSKVRSTLRQFVREWSKVGKPERDQAFGPLIDGLLKYLPRVSADGRRARVLCPGSGLGRLVFEVCRSGFSCQGNEFSYQMLLGANLMLNCGIDIDSLPLFPYVLSRASRKTSQSQFRRIQFPDAAVHKSQLEEGVQMSMTAGEFVEAYKNDNAVWDGLTTCFFIDTAKNVLQYVRLFAQILRPQGVWANIGPLLYHFADQPDDMSLELSWSEVKQIMSKYFDIKEERDVVCNYTACDDLMINTIYRCIYFVAIRNNVPVDGFSNPVYP
jgi:hypothetical protein